MLLSQKIAELKKEAEKTSSPVVVSRLNQALVTQQKLEKSQQPKKKDDSGKQDSSKAE